MTKFLSHYANSCLIHSVREILKLVATCLNETRHSCKNLWKNWLVKLWTPSLRKSFNYLIYLFPQIFLFFVAISFIFFFFVFHREQISSRKFLSRSATYVEHSRRQSRILLRRESGISMRSLFPPSESRASGP